MHSFKTSSPAWPKGVCPKSWERLRVSHKSSFKLKCLARVREICATSNE